MKKRTAIIAAVLATWASAFPLQAAEPSRVIANDKVWTSCTMILPIREKGSAGSPVRPVAIGVPGK